MTRPSRGETSLSSILDWKSHLRKSLSRLNNFKLIVCALILYLLAIIMKLHGSSMAVLGQRSNNLILGEPRSIRSDEYLRSSPTLLGQLSYPEQSNVSVLSQPSFNHSNFDSYDLLRPEQFLIQHILPVQNAYAALWWLPTLYISIGIFLITKKYSLRTWAQTALILSIVLSPGAAWWSNQLTGPLSRVILGIGIFIHTSSERYEVFPWLVDYQWQYCRVSSLDICLWADIPPQFVSLWPKPNRDFQNTPSCLIVSEPYFIVFHRIELQNY
jgi:hypothetical protein